jgi:Ca2+-binding RTX toxin-like protein
MTAITTVTARLRAVVMAAVAAALMLSFLAPAALAANSLIGTNGIDDLAGTGRADTISARAGDDRLYGAGGADTLTGGDGTDEIIDGPGRDVLKGSDGPDNLIGHGRDTSFDRFLGGAGDDTVQSRDVPQIADEVSCGPGTDTVYADRADTVASDCERVRLP